MESMANATACALNKLLNRFDHYKSLNGEDQMLLPTLISAAARGERGTFVELGAFTGEHSNTAVLERCFGWSGLLIEANPTNFAKLRLADRPRSHKVHSAVCNKTTAGSHNNSVEFTISGGTVAGQVDMLNEKHQQSWGHLNHASKTVRVPCQTLRHILADNDLKDGATFLSLDVEGAEELVLSTIRPSMFKVIMVETDASDKGKDERVRQLLRDAGMRFQQTLTRQIWNSSAVFIRDDVKAYPLPQNWTMQARLPGRVRWSSHVSASAMAGLLTRVAQGEPIHEPIS